MRCASRSRRSSSGAAWPLTNCAREASPRFRHDSGAARVRRVRRRSLRCSGAGGPAHRGRRGPCPGRAPPDRALSASVVAGDGELVLGVPEALLDLPAVVPSAPASISLELGPRLLGLAARVLDVDLLGAHRVVDEDERAVLLHLEVAGPGCERLPLAVATSPGSRRPSAWRRAGRGARARRSPRTRRGR